MSRRKAFALRLSQPIMEAVQRWADDELRSVNAQIEYVLREALKQAGRLPSRSDDQPDRDEKGK